MKLLRLFAGLLVIVVIAVVIWSQTTPTVPAPPPLPVKPVSGAAIYYKEAFAAIPELTESEKKLLIFKADQPIDTEGSRQLVAKFAPSLKLLEQGVRESQCEWGLDLNLGAEIPFVHLTQWISLAKVLRLKAKLEFDAGEVSQAADDLLMGFHIGRQVGEPPLFIVSLVRASTDSLFINLALGNLSKFDASARQRLSNDIHELPPAHSIRETLATEKQVFLPSQRRVFSRNARSKISEYWKSSSSIDNTVAKMLAASPRILLWMVDDIERLYNQLDGLFALPSEEARPKLEELENQVNKWRFLSRLSAVTLPVVMGIRSELAISETQWTILKISLDDRLQNLAGLPHELSMLRDSCGQPIEVHDVEGGVEVRFSENEGKRQKKLFIQLPKK